MNLDEQAAEIYRRREEIDRLLSAQGGSPEALLRAQFPKLAAGLTDDLSWATARMLAKSWPELERAEADLADWHCDHGGVLGGRDEDGWSCRYPRLRAEPGGVTVRPGPCPEVVPVVRRAAKLRRLRDAGVPERYVGADFAAWEADTPQRAAALETCRGWAARVAAGEEGRGLVLVGRVGVGKTFLVAATLAAVFDADRKATAAWLDVPVSLEQRRREMGNKSSPEAERWRKVEEAEVAVLDDLAAERATDWTRDAIFALLAARYDAELPTLITTNATPSVLAERLGERAASRLTEATIGVPVDGDDRRLRPARAGPAPSGVARRRREASRWSQYYEMG